MKKVFFILLLILIALTTISLMSFQDESGPHGGRVEKSGGFKIELVETYSSISTYLLDMKSNTLSNDGVCCSIKFIFLDNTHIDYDMASLGKEGFTLSSFPGGYHSCLVTFTVHERAITALFENRDVMAVYK